MNTNDTVIGYGRAAAQMTRSAPDMRTFPAIDATTEMLASLNRRMDQANSALADAVERLVGVSPEDCGAMACHEGTVIGLVHQLEAAVCRYEALLGRF